MKMDKEMLEDNLYRYGPCFNEIDFIKKIGRLTHLVSLRELLEKALQLWFLLQEQYLSIAERSVIIGALGYLIMVVDFIPDNVLGGYCDDLLIIDYAIQLLGSRVNKKLKMKAGEFAAKWL